MQQGKEPRMLKKIVDNTPLEEEESILLNPEEIKENKAKKEIETNTDKIKFRKKGNTVEINFESEGRFSVPADMWFEDYNVEHVQQLSTIELDDILETLTAILEEIKNKDCGCSIGDFTSSEFLETLIGINYKFSSPFIKHYWLCSCQNDKPEDEQKLNETMIDIATLKYKSITEADKVFKDKFKEIFNNLSDKEFIEFLKEKYASQPLENYDTWTREKELETIKIKDPMMYISKSGTKYGFELMKIRHVILAQREVNKKYRPKIKAILNRQNTTNIPLPDFKGEKEYELKKLDKEKAKDLLLYSQAYTIVSINGQKGINDNEKIKQYTRLKREEYFDLGEFLNAIEYGICDERDFTCPLCGKVERRQLQREINPIELLPINTNTKKLDTEKGSGRPNIYFGL